MRRSYAGIICGRRSKYVVLAIWVLLIMGAGPLAGKLSGAQDNQATSWLPHSAESTKAYQELSRFTDRDSIPAIVVYERTSGVTSADLAKAAADAKSFADVKGMNGKVLGPFKSQDGQAIQTVVPIHIDPKSGWNDLPNIATSIKDTATRNANGLSVKLGGPAGIGSDQAKAFEGIDGNLLYSARSAVVIVILLLTYRSPVLWLLPVISAGVALIVAQARHLPARQARRPHRQRAERRHPHRPRVRRRHRLRAAARRALPRGAAPARGPARGDGLRAAPRRPGDPRQRRHRRRSACSACSSPR